MTLREMRVLLTMKMILSFLFIPLSIAAILLLKLAYQVLHMTLS